MAGIRVRARTLDMLGRQQIAGVPTAISELFKNAHDAYASGVEVDFYRRSGLVVLRDDGVGMSHRDFLDRWLTLGTESKLGAEYGTAPPQPDPSQASRPIMGEKGIGRLAIAAIGPQVLVLTRAKHPEGPDQLVVAFIHWGIFGLAGVDLSAIQIPVRVLPGGTLPSESDISAMIAEVRANVESVATKLPRAATDSILAELAEFSVVPRELYRRLPQGPTLLDQGHGTHFIICPAEETLAEDIDGTPGDDVAPPLIKVLVGFTNTMTPGQAPPVIEARFRDHAIDGTVTERIAGSAFFTPEEFKLADHHVSGEFDEFGQFRGNVQVYGQEPVEYLLPWTEAGGRPLHCGPLRINFAYVQGEARATRLPPEEHGRMSAKLNRIGGLYIYRDGIRVLPYGNSDYDFLNIEKRRTKSASYYFFSYRRLFGVIDITRDRNGNLIEKAGREGFREIRAYRQLKQVLENFFVQLAADFFREGGLRADPFLDRRSEIVRNELLRRKRAEQARVRRDEFVKRLDSVFEALNAREPEAAVESVLESAEQRFTDLANQIALGDLAQEFLDVESRAYAALAAIEEEYRVKRGRGFGFTQQMQRDWDAYLAERSRLESEVFSPAGVRLAELVSLHTAHARTDLDHRRRLDRALKDTSELHRKRARSVERETHVELNQVRERVVGQMRAGLTSLDTAIRETVIQFESTDTTSLDANSFEQLRADLEAKIADVADEETNNLERLREQLQIIGTEDGLVQAEVTDAIEEELEALREQEAAELQLAQVGMALGIVHHEFASTIQAVRHNLRRLKPWADANQNLENLYREIRWNFDHLDGYLTLFTPLDKRLQRKRVPITGREVFQFLDNLFGERLKRHSIGLGATPAFREASAVGFPSSFYPCFVNLVDNAIFWISSRKSSRDSSIELDADGTSFVVTDNGPGILPRDAEAIFEMGFTRRPGGRGLGLYISRRILKEIGYELTLDPFETSRGARFRISLADGSEDRDADALSSENGGEFGSQVISHALASMSSNGRGVFLRRATRPHFPRALPSPHKHERFHSLAQHGQFESHRAMHIPVDFVSCDHIVT